MVEPTEFPNRQVYLIWSCPSSGVASAQDTFIFDDHFKISRQNIAFTKGGSSSPSNVTAAQAPDNGIGSDPATVCKDENGLALAGYDCTSYHDCDAPLKGDAVYVAEHNGAQYYFADDERRERFLSDPEKYLPAYGGYCAFAVANNDVFWINPESYLIQVGTAPHPSPHTSCCATPCHALPRTHCSAPYHTRHHAAILSTPPSVSHSLPLS